jgi:hypothetical protein
MKFNASQLSDIIDIVFEHFSVSQQPLVFHLAAQRAMSNPEPTLGHFANFLRHSEHFANDDSINRMIFDVIAISLVVWTQRNFSACKIASA